MTGFMRISTKGDYGVRALIELSHHYGEGPRQSAEIAAQQKIPEPYLKMGSLEFTKKLLAQAKVSVSPGIGFGEFGDEHVRFALIENESRTRQAIRGIKQMFREDGLL